MAFSVEGYWDKERKDSEEFVKWMAMHWFTDEDGNETETILDLHKCTQEELSEFYPVA